MLESQLFTRSRTSQRPSKHPPLLFVHGGYIHSGCWDLQFLPHFSALGFDSHALDLPGHGASAGREQLHGFDLNHYASDVAEVARTLPEPPVLIGHSMGALVVQRFLERGNAAGIVMMAPVPSTGLTASTIQLSARLPDFLVEAARAVRGQYSARTIEVMRKAYFPPEATHEDFAAFKTLIQDESTTAIAEMMALAWRPPRRTRPRIPALVIGGELDAIFPSSLLHFTAAGWNAETCVIPRAGHMMMMGPQWRPAADRIADWLATRFASR